DHLGEEGVPAEVGSGVEDQAVRTRPPLFVRYPVAQPPVVVGTPVGDLCPAVVGTPLQPHPDAAGGLAAGVVEDVGGQAHSVISLSSRSAVMRPSSARTTSRSRSTSLPSRARAAASICAGVRPLAKIRNTWPKRSSYSRLASASAARVTASAPSTPA